ncbi:MAG: hypothetical protein FWG70_06790 [Oscillospiraceae bacterium]|nr:hypothetical protein [Oscillospiraceae bacterium]
MRTMRILMLLLVFSLSGCAFGPIEDMLSPPRLTEEQQAIYTALVTSKGSGFKLKYPRTGEHRSAFVVYGDKKDAALVFYEISGINIERSLLMNFLYKDSDGRWESQYEIPIWGNDIESVNFASFGEDNEECIILSYTVGQVGQGEKRCMILRDIYSNPTRDFEDGYAYLSVDYFLGREYKELLIIKNERSVQAATATFYTYIGGRLFWVSKCELDSGADEYIGVTEGFITENVPALFINHRKYNSSDSYGTDVIFYRGRILHNPIIGNLDNMDKTFRRTSIVTELANPRDIDASGIFLLPSSAGEFPGYETMPAQERLRPVEWSKLEGDTLVGKYRSYYTERCGFVFLLPEKWYDTVTAIVSIEDNTVSFYRAGMPIDEVDELIFGIKTIFRDEELPNPEEWRYFKQSEDGSFRYYINRAESEDALLLSAEELENSFRILSEIEYEPILEDEAFSGFSE